MHYLLDTIDIADRRVRGFLKRKKRYLFLELAVLFLIFMQYIVSLTIEEKEKGQAEKGQVVLQEIKEQNKDNKKENDEQESDEKEDNKEEQETTEVISQTLADQIEKENQILDQVNSKEDQINSDENNSEYKEESSVVSEGAIGDEIEENQTENQKIRVLLKTTESRENYHDSVKITPSEDCVLSLVGNTEKTKVLKAGKKVTFKKSSSWLKKGTVLLTPKKGGKIKINSIRRSCGNPSYRGTLELTSTKQGIIIINELLLEEYLYAVVPSEMPVSYGIEALKVQAVCARCYAYSQLGSSAMKEFHADVDDSTSYQVYNNVAETSDSKKAVEETAGLVPITEDGKMITAYYYSTSCGYTANLSDAWEREEERETSAENKGGSSTYLIGKPQFIKEKEAEKELDLSKEKNFSDFLKKETRQTYDSAFPWYRWSVSVSKEALQESIEEHLEERWQANSSMIEILEQGEKIEDNEIRNKEEINYKEKKKKLGTWKGIELVKRSFTGMVTCMKILYSKGEIFVYGEYNIRCLLSPGNAKIKRQDGSLVSGLSLLPSSFFTMEKKGETYSFSGGGYGHGVGMSQNGVKTMVEKGYQWEDVLKHYYQGIKIEKIENVI